MVRARASDTIRTARYFALIYREIFARGDGGTHTEVLR